MFHVKRLGFSFIFEGIHSKTAQYLIYLFSIRVFWVILGKSPLFLEKEKLVSKQRSGAHAIHCYLFSGV